MTVPGATTRNNTDPKMARARIRFVPWSLTCGCLSVKISLLAIVSRFPARNLLHKNQTLHASIGPKSAVASTVFTLSSRFHRRLFRDYQHAAFWIGDKPYFHHFLLLDFSEQLVWRAFPRSFCGPAILARVGLLFHPADSFLRCEFGEGARDDRLWRHSRFDQLAE